MNTDARRKASAAYHAKREAEGLKKVTLWLSPEARARLDALKTVAGSKDKAAELAIMAWRPKSPVETIMDAQAKATAALAEPKAKRPRLSVSTHTLSGIEANPEPRSAALFGMVPLHKPKSFNPQPKKGSKK